MTTIKCNRIATVVTKSFSATRFPEASLKGLVEVLSPASILPPDAFVLFNIATIPAKTGEASVIASIPVIL